ncbi:leucine-rich repeat domain-containing protein [Muriicola sp.]|uniref:leucine-rich repeat domain-containing protein n=1 Tax=Muriicola sp. TaxID=2020856 RepID=UPI003C74CEBF
MKKQFIYLLVFTLAITSFSCSKDDGETIQEPIKSSAKQITGFVFKASENNALTSDVTAVINEQSKTISAAVPGGTTITSLTPTVQLSAKAIVDQTGAKDFSSPIDYSVTAEDGTTAVYKITVSIAPNSAKQILSFSFTKEDNELYGDETVTATIDEVNKNITATVSYSANASLLLPSIEVSPDASVSPDVVQDFSGPVVYTVTAEDGSTADYQVTLEITFTDRDALIAIYNANTDNTLGWDLNDPNIANWSGVQLDNEGRVRVMQMSSKQLTVLPSEIGKLSQLATLFVNNNELTDLPLLIKELSNLKVLYINNNDFPTIPEVVWTLSNLELLALSGLNLSSLSPGISSLSQLKTLYLGNNNLTAIPDQITDLVNLRTLSLIDNSISIVPSFISNLTALQNLDLANNEVRSISGTIGLLTNLEQLSFKNNDLVSVPLEIKNLTNLTVLDLTLNPGLFAISQSICELINTGTDVRLDSQTTCQ